MSESWLEERRELFILKVEIQPFRSTSEVPTQISGLPTYKENTIHARSKSLRTRQRRNSRRTLGLSMRMVCRATRWPGVGTSDLSQEFRRLEVLTHVETSNGHSHRAG